MREWDRDLRRAYKSRSRRAARQTHEGYPDFRPGYHFESSDDEGEDELVTPSGIACHEAGHAIVAAALGFTVSEVWTAWRRLRLGAHNLKGRSRIRSTRPSQPVRRGPQNRDDGLRRHLLYDEASIRLARSGDHRRWPRRPDRCWVPRLGASLCHRWHGKPVGER